MDQNSVLQILRAHQAELRAAGIVHLSLFGSVARGEASPESDVDLMAHFDPSRRLTLIHMVDLENRLKELLGVKVDLASADSLRDYVRDDAFREAVHAF
jgi:hypothetical protein